MKEVLELSCGQTLFLYILVSLVEDIRVLYLFLFVYICLPAIVHLIYPVSDDPRGTSLQCQSDPVA